MEAKKTGGAGDHSTHRGDVFAIAFFSIPCFLIAVWFWRAEDSVAAKRASLLQTEKSRAISASADTMDAANEGRLVYVHGTLKPKAETLTDPNFNVSTEAFALIRQVGEGGPKKVERLPYNPKLRARSFPTMVWKATEIKLGAFTLTWDQVFPLLGLRTKNYDLETNRLDSICKAAVPLPLTSELRDRLSAHWGERFVEDKKGWSIQLRDQYGTQVEFRQFDLPPTEISILAQQRRDGFAPFSLGGDSIFEVMIGDHDIESMFSIVQQKQMAKTYFVKAFCSLLFALGVGLVLQAFVPRKTRDAKKMEEMDSKMESGSDNNQALVLETKPFLLYHVSSQSFLSGETRDIRDRFRLDDPSLVSYMILAGLGVLFLLLYLIGQLVELSFQALRTPNTQGRIVGALIGIFALLNYMLRKNERNAALGRMIQDGQVLQGVIVSSKGRNKGNGEEYWYEVEIVFRFFTPQQIVLTGECSRDRDDLKGQPLPGEGSAVLVLYLNDYTYALL